MKIIDWFKKTFRTEYRIVEHYYYDGWYIIQAKYWFLPIWVKISDADTCYYSLGKKKINFFDKRCECEKVILNIINNKGIRKEPGVIKTFVASEHRK